MSYSHLTAFLASCGLLIVLCFIDNRAIKMNLANEGLEARKKEEEVTSRKRKAEEDKAWEGAFGFLSYSFCFTNIITLSHLTDTREQRVDSWRSFANGKKKKKGKVQVLG